MWLRYRMNGSNEPEKWDAQDQFSRRRRIDPGWRPSMGSTTTQARVDKKAPIGAAPIGAKPIDPFQIMMNSRDLPTEEFCQFQLAESCP